MALQLCYHLPCDAKERPPAATDSSDATTYAFQLAKRARNGGDVVWSSPPLFSRFASFTPADLGLDGPMTNELSVHTEFPMASAALDILVAAPPVLFGIDVQALPLGPALSTPSRTALLR